MRVGEALTQSCQWGSHIQELGRGDHGIEPVAASSIVPGSSAGTSWFSMSTLHLEKWLPRHWVVAGRVFFKWHEFSCVLASTWCSFRSP